MIETQLFSGLESVGGLLSGLGCDPQKNSLAFFLLPPSKTGGLEKAIVV